ncbi:LysR family transcriptional regulator [Kiritimatiellaeota bacterium B1221]|nr:LysR family transcriptional regulator [Kiritimatiellaeota bacterium B1221]
MTNPRYFEYALMIERFGSFKRASLELNLSQPALSKGIAALEKEYGVTLFNRESRPLVPTDAGRLVLEEGQRFIQGNRQLRNRLLELHGVVSHNIRIAWGPYASIKYATDFTLRFQAQFPNSEITFINSSWEKLPKLLRNRQVDLFVGDISSPELEEEFQVYPLPTEAVVYVCNRNHPLAKRKQLKLTEIYSHPLALCNPPPWAQKWLKTQMKDQDTRQSPACIRVDEYRQIEEIILKNSQVATLTGYSCFEENISNKNLVAIPLENAPYLRAGIVWSAQGNQTPTLEKTVSILKQLPQKLTA